MENEKGAKTKKHCFRMACGIYAVDGRLIDRALPFIARQVTFKNQENDRQAYCSFNCTAIRTLQHSTYRDGIDRHTGSSCVSTQTKLSR